MGSADALRRRECPEITEVFHGFWPPEYRRHLVFMLRAFLDASGLPRERLLVVGGLLGRVEAWGTFQREWRRAREKAGIPYFHMTDFMSPHGRPYNTWEQRKREAVISRLAQLINDATVFGFAVALSLDAFKDQAKTDRSSSIRGLSSFTPYRLCAGQCLALAFRKLKEFEIAEPVMYVFEAGDEGQPAFRASMARIVEASEEYRRQLGVFSVMPGTKRQFPALDAADFFVWEVAHHTARMDARGSVPTSGHLKRLTVPFFTGYLGVEELRNLAKNNTPEQMEAIAARFRVRIRAEKPRRQSRCD